MKQTDDQSGLFVASKWPPVSQQLIRMADAWVTVNVPIYKPGDSADQALGVLAFHAGMRHVITTLKQIHKSQVREIKRTSISTTTKE